MGQCENDTKEQLIKSAFTYLSAHGLDNASINAICREAGLSAGSFYYWFSDRKELYICAAEYGMKKISEKIFECIIENESNPDTFLNNILNEMEKMENELMFIYYLTINPDYREHIQLIDEGFTKSINKYAKILSQKYNCSEENVRPVLLMTASEIFNYIIWKDKEKTQTTLNFIIKLMRRCIYKNEPLNNK